MRIRSITAAAAGALLLSLAACTPGATPSAEGCEELAAADVLATGATHFTDTGSFTLTVDETAPVGDDRATVLTSVDPSDAVGYDPLLFFSECRGSEAVLLGVYVADEPGGPMTLLFTTQEGSDAGNVPMEAP
jgi:hypothetical protein